jgi:hypothetical protein
MNRVFFSLFLVMFFFLLCLFFLSSQVKSSQVNINLFHKFGKLICYRHLNNNNNSDKLPEVERWKACKTQVQTQSTTICTLFMKSRKEDEARKLSSIKLRHLKLICNTEAKRYLHRWEKVWCWSNCTSFTQSWRKVWPATLVVTTLHTDTSSSTRVFFYCVLRSIYSKHFIVHISPRTAV